MADVLHSPELANEPSDFGGLRPGTRLGRYELLVPIARGGMARVWAARQHGQRGFQKLVAIKTILPHLAEEPEFERMFLDEARIASGVHHPNVCEIYELGDDQRTLYLAMEWVSGDSLSRLLRANGKTEALDARVVARIVADACAGVHAAHELTDDDGRVLNVVHRDLSPHNVLLTADGVAKVCDFGVAKALGQLHEQTSAGQLKGKISYMAPEQVTGAAVDRRSDVFSLGCLLYEATTGVRPFKGEQDHMIMHAILNGELAPPTSFIRSYPPDLERIVLRALAHQPILRYPTAERMRFALEEFLTKGQLVTQSNVAQAVRTRLGEQLERRKERIKQASSLAEQTGWDPANAGSTRDAVGHRSGVQTSRPFNATMQGPGAGFAGPPSVAPPTVAPPTPQVAPPAPRAGASAPSIPPSSGGSIPTVALDSPPFSLPASSATMPHAHGSRAPQAASNFGAPVATTLPIGPGGIISPLHAAAYPPPVGASPAAPPMGGPPPLGVQPPAHPPPMGGPSHPPPMGGPSHPPPMGGPSHPPPMGGPSHPPPMGGPSRPPPMGGPSHPPPMPSPEGWPADHSRPGHPRDWSMSGHGVAPPPEGWPADHSRPGHPRDWSMSGHGVLAPPHTIPPASGSAASNPFGNTAIYDVSNGLPSLENGLPSLESPAEPQPPQAGAGQYALAAFVGLLFAVLIGGGGFFLWYTRTTTAQIEDAPPPPSATTPAAGASAAPTAPPVAPPEASAEIALRATPHDAVLLVDGKELPPETRSIPRPPAGQTVALSARAKGYADVTVQIDSLTTAPLELVLSPLEGEAPATPETPPADPGPAADPSPAAAPASSSAKPPSKPRPREPSTLPDNPY
ncbi:MAG: protein kinase [Labilithrix sp.]|nr:protein kinase [Labilithrix sp.]